MKILALFLLMISSGAMAKESIYVETPAQESCEAPLVVAPEDIFLEHNNLTITNDNKVFWRGQPVQLKIHKTNFEKTSRVLLRTLITLVENPYRPIDSNTIFESSWWAAKEYFAETPEEKIIKAIGKIRKCFQEVDKSFDAIKTYSEGVTKYVWDDGLADSQVKDIPDLKLTKYEAHWKNEKLKVTDGHRRMLRLLADNAGKAVSNRDLFVAFMGWPAPEQNNSKYVEQVVNWNLTYIRKAFRKVDDSFDRIGKVARGLKSWRLD